MNRPAESPPLRANLEVFTRGSLWQTSRPYGIRTGHRAGDARSAQDEVQDVVRLCQRIRGTAQYERVSGLPGFARRAAGGERRSPATDRAHWLPSRVHGCASREVRSEKLLLSGRSEELSNHSIRPALDPRWARRFRVRGR